MEAIADIRKAADSLSLLNSGATWIKLLSVGWLVAKWLRLKPRSLLDNGPLAELLKQLVPLERLPDLIRKGHMQALAVTASSYSSGEHITFFEGNEQFLPWVRSQRRSVRDHISFRRASHHGGGRWAHARA